MCEKLTQIETNLNSVYHESIIINNNNENNIFSINPYFFEFINIKKIILVTRQQLKLLILKL